MQPAKFPPLPALHVIYEKSHPKFKPKPKPKLKPAEVRIDIAVHHTTAPFSSPALTNESSLLLPLIGKESEYSNDSNSSCNRRVVTWCGGISACLLVFYIAKAIAGLLACQPSQVSDSC